MLAAAVLSAMGGEESRGDIFPHPGTIIQFVPSKMRTAVGKSLTLRAALRAAAMTEGAGTRS